MAILSTLAQTQLQSAIDLLVKGTAYETPISQDVLERIAPVIQPLIPGDPLTGGNTFTTGSVFEDFKNNPKTMLIALVAVCGVDALTNAQLDQLEDAAGLMLKGSAYESPFSEDVVQRLALVAESSNFLTRGGFYEAIRNNPVSTMLKWALKLGKI